MAMGLYWGLKVSVPMVKAAAQRAVDGLSLEMPKASFDGALI